MARTEADKLTKRMMRVLERAPLDRFGEAAYQQILIEMGRGPLGIVLTGWAFKLYLTAASGTEVMVDLARRNPDRAWPGLAADLIDAAAQEDVPAAFAAIEPIIDLDPQQMADLIWEMAWLYKDVADAAGGHDTLTDIIETHYQWAYDKDNPAIAPAALIAATVSAGNWQRADRYLECVVRQRRLTLGRLVEIWCMGFVALLPQHGTIGILEIDHNGTPQAMPTAPATDGDGDAAVALQVTLDLIAATRTADAAAFTDLTRRLAAMTLDQSLLMTRQFAHTIGVQLGQIRAQNASSTSR